MVRTLWPEISTDCTPTVAQYYHAFAADTKSEVAGRRVAKVLNIVQENERLKNDYLERAKAVRTAD